MKIVAKALILDASGKMLLLYRGSTHPNFPGHLDLPGGEVEEDEAWEGAVSREIFEETALKVSKTNLRRVVDKKYPKVTHVLYMANIGTATPEVTLSWEHSSYIWLKKNDLLSISLPKNVDKYFSDVIEHLKSTP